MKVSYGNRNCSNESFGDDVLILHYGHREGAQAAPRRQKRARRMVHGAVLVEADMSKISREKPAARSGIDNEYCNDCSICGSPVPRAQAFYFFVNPIASARFILWL